MRHCYMMGIYLSGTDLAGCQATCAATSTCVAMSFQNTVHARCYLWMPEVSDCTGVVPSGTFSGGTFSYQDGDGAAAENFQCGVLTPDDVSLHLIQYVTSCHS